MLPKTAFLNNLCISKLLADVCGKFLNVGSRFKVGLRLLTYELICSEEISHSQINLNTEF